MQYITAFMLCLLTILGTFISVSHAAGTQDLSIYGSIRFNNETWYTLPHPQVSTFMRHEDGSTTGYTEDGRHFYQYVVPNPYGIRVQRFEIEDHYHYIVEGEIIDSFTEFSTLLAATYQVKYGV